MTQTPICGQGWFNTGNVEEYLAKVVDVPGDFAEFGVFEGYLCSYVSKCVPHRTVWAFDTFKGIPTEDYQEKLDGENPPGKWEPAFSEVMERLSASNIRVIRGRFVDTIPTCTATQLALVHIDCDLYKSHKQIFGWIPDKLTNGSILIFDDYNNLPGAKQAIDEFVAEHNQQLVDNRIIYWKR